jgi:hypothetical protein
MAERDLPGKARRRWVGVAFYALAIVYEGWGVAQQLQTRSRSAASLGWLMLFFGGLAAFTLWRLRYPPTSGGAIGDRPAARPQV